MDIVNHYSMCRMGGEISFKCFTCCFFMSTNYSNILLQMSDFNQFFHQVVQMLVVFCGISMFFIGTLSSSILLEWVSFDGLQPFEFRHLSDKSEDSFIRDNQQSKSGWLLSLFPHLPHVALPQLTV